MMIKSVETRSAIQTLASGSVLSQDRHTHPDPASLVLCYRHHAPTLAPETAALARRRPLIWIRPNGSGRVSTVTGDRATDIRGVLFDFNGTLVRLATWATHEAVFRRRGLTREAAAWGDRWSVGPADGEEHSEHSTSREAYRQWEFDRFRVKALACGVGHDQLDDLVSELDRATHTFTLELYDDVRETLQELRARGLIIAVCSNWFWDLDQAVDEIGLTEVVHVAVTSAQAGARKPHPRVFLETLQKCELRPENALYVGDTWKTDIEGSRSVGMSAAYIARPEQRSENPPPSHDGEIYRINDLRELCSLV